MVSIPKQLHKSIKQYATCPDPIWQAISFFESKLNPVLVTEVPDGNGYKYGLFQLHVTANGHGGLGNTALVYISNEWGLTDQAAITFLLQNPETQAKIALPPINAAWEHLKDSFEPLDTQWWYRFASLSGHPGGTVDHPATQAYVSKFMKDVVHPNLFGIQQVVKNAGPSTVPQQDTSWLQALINMPPHQPCNIIWRRTCPGAINALEGGMDLPAPSGTPIYSLGDGYVIGAGNFWHGDGSYGYGVVTVRTTMPDGTQADIYYQHINISTNIILCGQTGGQLYNNIVGPAPTNQKIIKGQQLGTVSALGETEVGINAEWGGVWGTNHPGAWVDDPEDDIRSLMNAGGGQSAFGVTIQTGNSQFDSYLQTAFTQTSTAVQTLSQTPGLSGPIQVFDNAQKFKPFAVPDDNSSSANWPIWGGIETGATYPARLFLGIINFFVNNTMAFIIRSLFTILAMIIIIALIINAISQTTEKVDQESGNWLPEAAETAALL